MIPAIASPDGLKIAYQPLPKQWAASRCPAFEILYAGDKGSAKTHWLVGTWLELIEIARKKH